MEIGVFRFPGTNNEHETLRALNNFEGVSANLIEYKDLQRINDQDAFVIPGGFSFGDILRAGAIAKTTETVQLLRDETLSGKLVFGICNGFQILTEAGLLPGALLPNRHTRFVSKFINIKISDDKLFGDLFNQVMRIPIAHFEGNYWNTTRPDGVLARYSDIDGRDTEDSNPNGSLDNIAGMVKNSVAGMMPHPERAFFKHQGSTDGRKILKVFVEAIKC